MAAVATTMTAWQPPDAEAVVVCQRGQKKFRLRAETCKAKETPVFDTNALDGRVDGHDGQLDAQAGQLAEQGEQLTEQGGQLTDQGTRVDNLEVALAHKCDGAPERELIPVSLVGGGRGTFGCRELDGDQAGCEQRFQTGEDGASACAYFNDNCIPCGVFLDALGVCDNPCQPVAPCADAARTAEVGDCDDVTTQPACEQSWGISFAYPTTDALLKPTTCWWNGLDCDECQPDDVSNGDCTNTCVTPEQLPVCRAAGRTYGDCGELDGNEAGCLSTYEMDSFGTHTCWYDTGDCKPCDPVSEHAGSCQNLC
jgi:hypothetical protein